MNSLDDDDTTALTPDHFLIGKPLVVLPDSQVSYRLISLLKQWHLCQQSVRHFWEHWHNEYLYALNKYNKWHFPTRNVTVGYVVIFQEMGTIPTKWPITRVIADELVCVVTIKTIQGTYKRPVSEVPYCYRIKQISIENLNTLHLHMNICHQEPFILTSLVVIHLFCKIISGFCRPLCLGLPGW